MRGVPVTEGRDVQAQLPLLVPLLEELLHAPGSPLLVELPPLGGVRHVHSVQQETHHLRLLHTESADQFELLSPSLPLSVAGAEKVGLHCFDLSEVVCHVYPSHMKNYAKKNIWRNSYQSRERDQSEESAHTETQSVSDYQIYYSRYRSSS